MPAFAQLSSDQIWQIIAFLRDLWRNRRAVGFALQASESRAIRPREKSSSKERVVCLAIVMW